MIFVIVCCIGVGHDRIYFLLFWWFLVFIVVQFIFIIFVILIVVQWLRRWLRRISTAFFRLR